MQCLRHVGYACSVCGMWDMHAGMQCYGMADMHACGICMQSCSMQHVHVGYYRTLRHVGYACRHCSVCVAVVVLCVPIVLDCISFSAVQC